MTDERKIFISLPSTDKVLNSIGSREFAKLVIRCQKNSIEAFISTPTYNGDSSYIGTRWSGGKPSYGYWNKAVGGDAFFSPDPKSFVKELKENSSLVFQWSPYQKKAVAVTFSLSEFQSYLEKAKADGCPIK